MTLQGSFSNDAEAQHQQSFTVTLYLLEFDPIEPLNYTIGDDPLEVDILYEITPDDEVDIKF